jgi:hypothetical protein
MDPCISYVFMPQGPMGKNTPAREFFYHRYLLNALPLEANLLFSVKCLM